jgi:hypothetical protein
MSTLTLIIMFTSPLWLWALGIAVGFACSKEKITWKMLENFGLPLPEEDLITYDQILAAKAQEDEFWQMADESMARRRLSGKHVDVPVVSYEVPKAHRFDA